MEDKSIILLVEDNESHALLVKRGISQSDINAEMVHVLDGEEALEYLLKTSYTETNPNIKPKLVLLDLRLPKMDGIDVLKEVKRNEDISDIPIVVLTSSMAEPDILRAYYYHANSYLVKHIDFSQFRQQIIDTVQYWIRWNITPL
ncbi:response regulator [Chitinispirillales bacterium ANBcel5]|uniref:response regulator n=1 Tax=Cellulosispirillum alkaliphilum TaxID=3039283 RepID=UPI002A585F7E|nr:response regulator [Chitinispirillales bacterium ANBcel5]